jgi:hypothetical protein
VIPVYEGIEHFLGGLYPHTDCNLRIGELTIYGSDRRITQDLPKGSKINVTIFRDRDRQTGVKAHVPLLDETGDNMFTSKFELKTKDPSPEEMEKQLENIKKDYEKIKDLQAEYPIAAVEDGLKTLDELDVLKGIETKLNRTKEGHKESQTKCHRDILSLRGALFHLWKLQTEARIRRLFAQLKGKVEGAEKDEMNQIAMNFDRAVAAKDEAAMATVEDALMKIYYQVRLRPYFQLFGTLLRFPDRFNGYQYQHDSYKRGLDVFKEIDKVVQDGGEVTDGQLHSADEANKDLWKNWMKELNEWGPRNIDFGSGDPGKINKRNLPNG